MKAPPFPLAVGAELRINDVLQVIYRVSPSGAVELRCPLRGILFKTTVAELASMRMSGRLEPAGTPTPSYVPKGTPKGDLLTEAQHRVVARRLAYVRVAVQEYPVGPNSPRLKGVVDEVAKRLQDRDPPSRHSVYRWLRRYVQSGYDTAVFMQDVSMTRTRAPRVPDSVKTRLKEHIERLLGSHPGVTLNGITDMALALTARDLGHITFITKDGLEMLVDEYVALAEQRLRQGARRVRLRRKQPTRAQAAMEQRQ